MPVPQNASTSEDGKTASQTGWRFADIEIDLRQCRATRDGAELPLERSAYALLEHLAAHAGAVVAKEALLGVGWPGRVVSENSLAKAIGRLRQAIGDQDASVIRVVHGYGYRLQAEVEPISALTAAASIAPAAAPASGAAGRRAMLLMLGLLLIGALAALGLRLPETSPAAVHDREPKGLEVIAVLPFRDLSADRSLGMLADGIGNHLRDQVQRVPALRVVKRADSLRHREDQRDSDLIARELGANLLLRGELSRDRDRLRVVMHLHDVQGRLASTTQVFERAAIDQATLLEDLTGALLAGLGDHPDRWGHDPERGRGTANEEAYRSFLRAATLFGGNNDPNSHRRAMALIEQALDLDPNYADAWLTLGGLYGGSGYYADTRDELVTGRSKAIAAMDRGLALAPDEPTNYLLRSEMRLLYFFDWQGALDDIRAAAERTPGGESAAILIWKARVAASLGRIDEAISLDARAIALDPESGARRNQGWHYLGLGDTRNARAVLLLQLEDLPENPHTNFYLALCDILEGQHDAALRRLELSSTLFRLVGTAIAQHERGDRAASDLALQKLKDQFAVPDGYWAGAVHAWRGEHDDAVAWIERAMRGGDSSVLYLKFDPLLRGLRNDPRYAELVAALKIPDDLPPLP